MKKLLLVLTLSTFVAPMAINTYAAANGIKVELNDDDKKKKRKKKKSCCALYNCASNMRSTPHFIVP